MKEHGLQDFNLLKLRLFDINLVNFNNLVHENSMYMFSNVSLQLCFASSPFQHPLLNDTKTHCVVTRDLFIASAMHNSVSILLDLPATVTQTFSLLTTGFTQLLDLHSLTLLHSLQQLLFTLLCQFIFISQSLRVEGLRILGPLIFSKHTHSFEVTLTLPLMF